MLKRNIIRYKIINEINKVMRCILTGSYIMKLLELPIKKSKIDYYPFEGYMLHDVKCKLFNGEEVEVEHFYIKHRYLPTHASHIPLMLETWVNKYCK